jgi:type I restriction enzyme M protein
MFFLKIIDDQDQELELMQDGYRSPIPAEILQWRTWAADPEGITGEALLAFVNGELFPALKACRSPASRATAAASCATCSRTPTTT